MLGCAPDVRSQQLVVEQYAEQLFSDRCSVLLEALVQRNLSSPRTAKRYRQLQELWVRLRARGIAVFGPVPTPMTCGYPGGGPGVTLLEQMAGTPEEVLYASLAKMMPPPPVPTRMASFDDQMRAAVIELAQYWELGHMKNAITPGLGNIGPFLRKRAYLVLADPMLVILQQAAGSGSDHGRSATGLLALIVACRRDGIDAALAAHPQPGGQLAEPVAETEAAFMQRMRGIAGRAGALCNERRHPEALVLLEGGEAECRRAENDFALVYLLHEKAITISTGATADPARALQVIEEAADLCQVLGLWSEAHRILQSKGVWYRKTGDDDGATRSYAAARKLIDDWLAVARAGTDYEDLVEVLVMKARASDRDVRERLFQEALAVAKAHGLNDARARISQIVQIYNTAGL
jgi:hypothetical protein